MGSQAIAAKKAIRDLIEATLTGQATVTWGGVKNPPRVWAVLGKTSWDSSDWATVGNRRRDESFTVAVGFNLKQPGKPEDAETRVLDLGNLVEAALRANPTLDGIGYDVAMIPADLASWPTDTGAEAQLDCKIRVRARI